MTPHLCCASLTSLPVCLFLLQALSQTDDSCKALEIKGYLARKDCLCDNLSQRLRQVPTGFVTRRWGRSRRSPLVRFRNSTSARARLDAVQFFGSLPRKFCITTLFGTPLDRKRQIKKVARDQEACHRNDYLVSSPFVTRHVRNRK
jgi:hypothetical protein